MNIQDAISIVEVIGVVLTQVFFNTVLGYLGAILVFALIIPRLCHQPNSAWNLICEAYRFDSLKECVIKIRLHCDWKKDIGVWIFFTIGARSLFDFTNFNATAFLSSVALTGLGSLLIAVQWIDACKSKIHRNNQKEAEQVGDGDAEEAV